MIRVPMICNHACLEGLLHACTSFMKISTVRHNMHCIGTQTFGNASNAALTSMIVKVLLATHVLWLTSGHLHCSNDSWEVGFSFRLELVTRTFQLRSINVETFREFFNSIQLRKIITISCMLDNPPQMFVFLYWRVGWGTQKVKKWRTLMATSKHYTCTLYWG